MENKTTKIYRIENHKTMHGMWYDKDGNFNPFIQNLTDGVSKNLPMGHCDDHRRLGKVWYSGCENIEDLKSWFSAQDALELEQAGYLLFIFEVTETYRKENETLFTRESIVAETVIPLSTVWEFELEEPEYITPTQEECEQAYGMMECHDMEQIFGAFSRKDDEMRKFARSMFTEEEINIAIDAFSTARYLYGRLYEAAEEGIDEYE